VGVVLDVTLCLRCEQVVIKINDQTITECSVDSFVEIDVVQVIKDALRVSGVEFEFKESECSCPPLPPQPPQPEPTPFFYTPLPPKPSVFSNSTEGDNLERGRLDQ